MEDTVRRAMRGDAQAFEVLVGAEVDDLWRLAVAIVLDRDVGHDVVQDSLVAAWNGLPRLRDPRLFRTWIRRIVINRARNALRRPRTTSLVEAITGTDPTTDWDDVLAIEAAMRQLTPDLRACAALFYLQRATVAEIAQVLDCPEGTVKSRLHAARARLREALR
ncbi:MAG: RNA polymerase sigma factor [Candidatus Limnocylindria bacterium]